MYEKVKKANSMAAIVRRSFQNLDNKTFLTLYKALVRSHLDYASTVWCPYKEKYNELIEGVQRRATRQLPGYKDLPYEERLKLLKLPTLKYRRIRGDMIETYKIMSEKYDPEVSNFLKMRKDHTARPTVRGNSKKLFNQRPKLDIRKYSFAVRIINMWNSLPENVISAKTTNTFKNRLDKYWANQEVVYNYKCDLSYVNRTGTGTNVVTIETSESDEEDPTGTCVGNSL